MGGIAILGWGSLLWDRNEEFDQCHDSWFTEGGPRVPVEFARESQTRDCALTLVIDSEVGAEINAAWCRSKRTRKGDAVKDLAKREGCRLAAIGTWSRGAKRKFEPGRKGILAWAKSSDFDHVIWTDLPSNLRHPAFSDESAVARLNRLSPDGRRKAAEYINKAPDFVQTVFRSSVQIQNNQGNPLFTHWRLRSSPANIFAPVSCRPESLLDFVELGGGEAKRRLDGKSRNLKISNFELLRSLHPRSGRRPGVEEVAAKLRVHPGFVYARRKFAYRELSYFKATGWAKPQDSPGVIELVKNGTPEHVSLAYHLFTNPSVVAQMDLSQFLQSLSPAFQAVQKRHLTDATECMALLAMSLYYYYGRGADIPIESVNILLAETAKKSVASVACRIVRYLDMRSQSTKDALLRGLRQPWEAEARAALDRQQ